MSLFKSLLPLTFFLTSFAWTQEKERSPEELYFEELVTALNFVVVQEEALKTVARQHPDLAADAEKVMADQKKTSIGTAIAALRKELSVRLGDQWEESQKTLRDQIIKNDLNRPLTKETAQTMVKQYGRVKDGLVPNDILRILISLHPDYIETPTKEIDDGWIQPIQKKSADKTFSLFLPGSWKPREMKSPRNLIGVVHKAGYGICTLSLTAIPVAPQLYEQEYAKHSPVELGKILIPKHAKIISSEEVVFVETKGSLSIYNIERDEKPVSRIVQYAAYQEEHFVLFQLSISLNEHHDVDFLTAKFQPVLMKCAQGLRVK